MLVVSMLKTLGHNKEGTAFFCVSM